MHIGVYIKCTSITSINNIIIMYRIATFVYNMYIHVLLYVREVCACVIQ